MKLVDEWAAANGAEWEPDWSAGHVTVTRNRHKLVLKVGTTEAVLDNARLTLTFPVLRHGKNQVWCPISALQKL